MVVKKRYVLCVAAVVFVAIGMYANKNKQHDRGCKVRRQKCTTEKNCIKNQNCQCYCSEKGSFRDKVADDKPAYVENDPNGVYCYCKQWDLDKYPGPAERDK